MPLIDLKYFPSQQLLDHSAESSYGEDPRPESSRRQTGKNLQLVICVLLVELCERFTFFGTVCNMILFCTIKLGYGNHEAAIVNLVFVGTSTLTPVLVSWFVESCAGRTKVIYACALLHFVGTALLPVVAFPFEDFYIDTRNIAHGLGHREQTALFYAGLLMASVGSGGIRAIVCPLGAYNLQGYKRTELMSFFNWFYWLVNLNSLVVFSGIAYIQQSVAKNLGFLIPFMSVVMSLITIHMIRGELLRRPKKGAALPIAFGVFTNALRMCCVTYRHVGGCVTTWLDRAKENNGGWYSESHVESTKALVRLFPLFTSQILYRTCATQISSGYFIQTMNSDLSFNGFLLPIAAMKIISIIPLLIIAPCLECFNSYVFSKTGYGLSPSVSIICGHLGAALSLLLAGVYEMQRKNFPLVEQTLSGKVLQVSSMSAFQLAPQYALLGFAEAMVTPSCSVITFRFAPSRLRSTSMHFLTLFNAAGCFTGALMVDAVFLGSGGDWYPDLLPRGHFERFFFFLASVMFLNALGFWMISRRYDDLDQEMDQGFRGDLLEEKLLQHEKSLKFYESIYEWSSHFSPMETTV
ncbi:solute carrier family 15 member 5 [Spea bombifrons]|uniref:solute carrier family 15 member 5 n=1 Tax=Spea bombifrons TaxID=233779 RepID=UPI00234BFBE1|nr:solute carrier family 15 member 5 [Spea bombifrons]